VSTAAGWTNDSVQTETALHVNVTTGNLLVVAGDVAIGSSVGPAGELDVQGNVIITDGTESCSQTGDGDLCVDNDLEVDSTATITGSIYANANNFYWNYDGSDADVNMYFFDSPGGATQEWLKWDNNDDRFESSNDVYVTGNVEATGDVLVTGDVRATNLNARGWVNGSSLCVGGSCIDGWSDVNGSDTYNTTQQMIDAVNESALNLTNSFGYPIAYQSGAAGWTNDTTDITTSLNATIRGTLEVEGGANTAILASNTDSMATHIYSNPISTNTIVEILRISRLTSKTAASGIGGAINFYLEDTAGESEQAGQIATIFKLPNGADSSHESSAITFSTRENGGSLIEKLRIGPLGKIGIGTQTATTKLDINGTLNISDSSGKIWTPEICIDGTCRTTWPTTSGVSNAGGWTNTSTTTSTSLNAVVDGNFNITGGSVVIGTDNSATGIDGSIAMGYDTTASGIETSIAMGWQTTAEGARTTAMGSGTNASGSVSTAMGFETTASGEYSTAMGHTTKASGNTATAMGHTTKASGTASTAMGLRTNASGDYSTAMGRNIEAGGNYSVAIALNDQNGANVTQANTMAIMGGKVGINTTSPDYALEVVGDTYASGKLNSSNLFTIGLETNEKYKTHVGVDAGTDNNKNSTTLVGYEAGIRNKGIVLTAVGNKAGHNNTGNFSAFLGHKSGWKNLGLGYVTATGSDSARLNTGAYVTASGYKAARENTGDEVTAIGVSAGYQNTQDGLTAVGHDAGEGNSGTFTTSIGTYAGESNSGNFLTAIGYEAAQGNSQGFVTALGYRAADTNSGFNITAVGHKATMENIGDFVTAIGYRAAYENWGDYVTAIGHRAATDNNGYHSAIAIGFNATPTAVNQLVIGNSNANGAITEAYIGVNTGSAPLIYANTTSVGIGTDTPSKKLEISDSTQGITFHHKDGQNDGPLINTTGKSNLTIAANDGTVIIKIG